MRGGVFLLFEPAYAAPPTSAHSRATANAPWRRPQPPKTFGIIT